jgi:oligopeptide/dipeptide ABC transporter ATP-binding protein
MALLEVTDLHKHYVVKNHKANFMKTLRELAAHRHLKHSYLHAIDGVGFHIDDNESVGLVGESGCGKSTLVKAVCRLLNVSSGSIVLNGRDIAAITNDRFVRTAERAQIQVVFQDSHESLNPRYTAYQCIADPLKNLLNIRAPSQLDEKIHSLAEQVNFPIDLLQRLPHQLSGGQKARVNIARAIAVSPKLLILDEPTSALDVSVQALILRLLVKLREELNTSYLFVSHDLNVVRMLCERIIVMYMGKIVESGAAHDVFYHSAHPYTQALISSIPSQNATQRMVLDGEIGSPIDPDPNVCRFHGRCPMGDARCRREAPPLRRISPGHSVACHFA